MWSKSSVWLDIQHISYINIHNNVTTFPDWSIWRFPDWLFLTNILTRDYPEILGRCRGVEVVVLQSWKRGQREIQDMKVKCFDPQFRDFLEYFIEQTSRTGVVKPCSIFLMKLWLGCISVEWLKALAGCILSGHVGAESMKSEPGFGLFLLRQKKKIKNQEHAAFLHIKYVCEKSSQWARLDWY